MNAFLLGLFLGAPTAFASEGLLVGNLAGADLFAILLALAAGLGFIGWVVRGGGRPAQRPVHPDEMPSPESKRAAKRQADAEAAHAETHKANVDALTDPDGRAKRDKLTEKARTDPRLGKRGSALNGPEFLILLVVVILLAGCGPAYGQPVDGPCRPIAVKPLVYDVVMCRPDAVIDVRPEAISCRCDWETS